jgi:hypothetical protein
MKETIFASMHTYFGRVTGFTQEMQQVVFDLLQSGGMDLINIMERSHETLTSQFGMSE